MNSIATAASSSSVSLRNTVTDLLSAPEVKPAPPLPESTHNIVFEYDENKPWCVVQILTCDGRRVNARMGRHVVIGHLRALVFALMPSGEEGQPLILTLQHTQTKLDNDAALVAEVAEGMVITGEYYVPSSVIFG